MPFARVLRMPALVAMLASTTGCALSMGTVSEVDLHPVSWADVDKHGMQSGCCGHMHWLRVDFVSDMDYADRARRGIPVWVHFGWRPLTDESTFAVLGLLTSQGEVDSGMPLTPVTGEGARRRYAYHAFLPLSSPARFTPRPGKRLVPTTCG